MHLNTRSQLHFPFAPKKTNCFTADQKDVLIDVIYQRPVIWDSSLTDYKNPQNRIDAFAEVAKLFSDDKYNYTGAQIEYEWENLRDTFNAILARLSRGGNRDDITWRYWPKLQFIAKFVTPMPEKSPINAEDQQSDNEYTNEATPDKPTGKIYLTAEKDEALISAIKDRPVIWDPFHPYYKNNIQRCNVYAEVAEILSDDNHKYSGRKVMMVWKNLLATFRKVKTNDLTADDKVTWRYWQKRMQRSDAYAEVAEIVSDDNHKYSGPDIGVIWRSWIRNFRHILRKVKSNGGADDKVTWQHWHKLQFLANKQFLANNEQINTEAQKSKLSKEFVCKGSQDYVFLTSEQKEAFIDAIRERQIIWGFMPRYFNEFQERRAAYNEVAEILSNNKLKYTGPEMQYLWHNLRHAFQDKLKKVIANGGDDSKITWIYWKKLKFIEEYERTKINIRMPEQASFLNLKKAGEEEEEEQINEPSTSDNYHHASQKEKDFVNNLNSMTVDLSNFAIFPDEVEKGIKKLDGHVHVKTRSSTCNNDNILSINASPNLTNSNNSTNSQIDEWKKKSRYFTNCAHTDTCDPFGLFEANEENICFSCLEIRADLRKKAILMWDSEQLEQQLCDYAYFHAIKIFNPNAEYQFANSKSQHPYFLSYKNIRQQVKIILKNLSSLFNFPSEMTNAAKRAFMKQTKNNQNALRISSYCKICCEKVTFTTCVLTFEGNKYRNNFELIENDDPKPNNFIVCFRHAKLFCIYYRLLHMDWNIHWNCYLRISQIQKRLPNLNDSNVINAIDPQIFMYISKEYFSLFKMLDERLYDGSDGNKKSFNHTVTDSLLEGFYSWDRFNDYIKDMGILKRIEEEK
uniref:MADF domain-containing protein n=1 Tax=Meloidogyne incognita TaxID=6306 RepID=A0A914KPA5_MELIC